MKQDDPIVITGAARTPIGSFQGSLAPVAAPELGESMGVGRCTVSP